MTQHMNVILTTRHVHTPMMNCHALFSAAALFSASKWLVYLALSTKWWGIPGHSMSMTSSSVNRIVVSFAIHIAVIAG